jgi:ATP-binding cassette subfamily F protein uup
MNYLSLENVSKTYGEKVLFDKIDFQVSKGEKIALVAKNGAGKSTLLKVIAGVEPAEGETKKVWTYKNIKIGYLVQDPSFEGSETVLDAVFDLDNPLMEALRAYEEALIWQDKPEKMEAALAKMDDLKAWDFEARFKEILFKLNITDLGQKINTLSGGQKKRLALAKLIIDDPEFLILDEPTNHLDLEMIEWLENYLQQSRLTILMVTHDRYFLERVCSHIVELDGGVLYRYKGSYSDFLEKKSAREENQSVVLDRTKKLMRRELEWVRRMPKARGTKAKARVDKFHEIKEKATQRVENDEIQIDIKGQRMGKKILEAHNISKRFGDFVAVEGFDYKFRKKEKVGIIGPNGVGKSTFLKVLTKELRPDTGKVVLGGNTVFGYYTQEGIQLEKDQTIIEYIRNIAEFIPLDKGRKLTAEQLCERFLFNRKQQRVYISQLSGGERRRLFLLAVLMENPNFLILDEPTNDLDILTLNILEDFLLDFPGCIIIVTHDRYFMDKLVEHLFVFEGNGKIKDFNGTYTEYRSYQKAKELEEKRANSSPKEKKAKPAFQSELTQGLSREQQKEFKRLEKQIEKLEAQKADLTSKFSDTSLSAEEIEKYSIELGELNEVLEEKEMRWMELADLA